MLRIHWLVTEQNMPKKGTIFIIGVRLVYSFQISIKLCIFYLPSMTYSRGKKFSFFKTG
jgi:hypothetical protein